MQQEHNMADAAASKRHYPLEILAFTLGGEEYGIDIQQVQELRGYVPATKIANAPAFIKGVMNLRGIIVPIIDMRIKFQLAANYDDFTVVIIINVGGQVCGIVVDRVSDVISLQPEQMREAPALGSAVQADYLIGLAVVQERMLLLMDLHNVIAAAPDGQEKIAA